jgi:hypothetical protein
MFRQLFIFGAMLVVAHGAVAQGRIETPRNGTTISGKAIFSGWYCDATEITISIDGAEQLPAAYGTTRGDTVGNCGDSNNGWGLLYNFGGLDNGAHTVVAYADGEQFATSTFNVTKLSTGEFLSGASATTTVNDFPSPGNTITLTWEQTLQNFVITNELIPSTGGADVLQDGVAASQYDAGIFAFDQALGYGACGGGPAPDTGCESIAFEVVDDADRGSVLEISYLSDQFAGIVIDSDPPGLDMSAYETGVLKFDIKVVSAGDNTTYKVKLDDHNGGSTGEFDVDADNSGSWATYSVNMSDLLVNVDGNGVGGNLSLNTLKAVVFMATFGATQDVVFRLDNVYFQQ